MRYRAAVGELRAGPHRAARLGDLDLRRLDDRQNQAAWAGSARVLERDAFWSEHGGALDLVVPVGPARWVWRGVRVAWGDGAVGISGAGAPEVVSG